MTPERYKLVGDLFHAALELAPAEREAFLDNECASDAQLRCEVESLIASHNEASEFIASPAFAVAAELIAEEETDEFIGKTVGRYVVHSLLGVGGMGRVYLAEDLELGRRVALKVLLKHFTHDETQLQRFRREARAASALNHPNILTVHEIGQVDGSYFIATEYVEGETLRDRLHRFPFTLGEAIITATQIADALATAHAAGIIHRDIKPENVMVRRDGYVKVLDFGLAKLTEKVNALEGTVHTDPSVIMGTVYYMSPEQLRGGEVDARTDVWSLSVLLYELVAQRRPFEEETRGDTIVTILRPETTRLLNVIGNTPAELQRILAKALSKNIEERYQSAQEMATDLRQLRRKLELDSPLALTGAIATGERTEAKTGIVQAAKATSSLEFAVNEIRRHKTGVALVVILLIAALTGLSFGLYKFLGRAQSGRLAVSAAASFQQIKMARLTATGKVKDAAISPDGKYVVYTEENDRQQSLWVRQVATGSSMQIVASADIWYSGLTFSPDGDYVYYVKGTKDDSSGSLYQVPSIGGGSKKMLEHVDSAVTFSPDGRRFAFVRAFPQRGESTLVFVNVDGTEEQTLATRKTPDFFQYEGIVRPAWSPDGKTIACPAGSADADGPYYNVVGTRVEDGAIQSLTSQRWGWASQVAWLSDGSGLAVVAGELIITAQLWRLSYPGGEARQITKDLNWYNDVSLTRDSKTLVTVQSNRASNIWVAPGGDASRARQITADTSDSSLGLSWTPDGKIIYQSDATGRSELWVMNADGSDRTQLTHEGSNYRPAISPSGRHIVFHSGRGSQTNIWRMDLDGGNLKQLTNGKTNLFPDLSPDGRWVVYASGDSGMLTLWKVSVDGGKPVQLSDVTANMPAVSPDGRHIASFYWDETHSPTQGVMVIPFAGGQPVKRFDIVPDAINGFVLHWSPDGRDLLYLDDQLSNIWSRALDGGKPVQLTRFQGDQIFNFAWSHDGKWLALARGRLTDDAVLINDLK